MEDIKDRDAKFDGVSMVIIVCSTTGEGDPPDNASRLYRRLKSKKHGADHLAHIKYTVLGLGDTNYSDFCTSFLHIHTHTHTHTHTPTHATTTITASKKRSWRSLSLGRKAWIPFLPTTHLLDITRRCLSLLAARQPPCVSTLTCNRAV